MSRAFVAAVLAAIVAVPFAARAQGDGQTRTVVVGNTRIIDIKQIVPPGSPTASPSPTPEAWTRDRRDAMPMTQILAWPMPPRDR